VGQAVTLGAAQMPGGEAVADQGSFAITQQLGSPTGYATQAEADAAAQSGLSTNISGTMNYRWLVIQHGSQFYAYQAQLDQGGTPQMPAQNGTVVGWHALRAIETGGLDVQWEAYDWSQQAGSNFRKFANADGTQDPTSGASGPTGAGTSTAGGVSTGGTAGGTPAPTTGTPTTTSTSSPGAGTSSSYNASTATTGAPTGTAAPQASSPAPALIGHTFAVNAASYSGGSAAGGQIQLSSVLDSSVNGFDTPGEAADAARLARTGAGGANPWERWVTMKLSDNRYYVFDATVVSAATQDVGSSASPMHIFGNGFAEFYNGSAWAAQPDSGE
jgi:hypothetical protein